jgi:hypothetical protein
MLVTGDGNRYFALLNNSGTYRWESSLMTGSNQYVARYTPSITTGVWYHIALIKSGSTLSFYQDGTSYAGTTIAGSMTSTSTLFVSGSNILGAYTSANYSLNGWLDEIRVSNSARYTANFTPSTTPFVNDSNTTLLYHFNGTDASTVVRDDNGVRSPKGITVIGNAQIDTAQSKFGGAAALFDGTGDYLDATSFSQSAGDTFTFECWVRFAATPSSGTLAMLISSTGSANRYLALNNVSGTLNWEIGHEGSAGTFYRRWTATVSTNTWYHIALTKNGTTGRLFVNGTLLTPAQDFGTLDASEGIFSETMRLGAWNNGANALNGHMDEIRISDIERYTTSFTEPTAAFQNDANTLLLLHMDGTDASTAFFDDNGIAPYTP